jgi:hypothetical protein
MCLQTFKFKLAKVIETVTQMKHDTGGKFISRVSFIY